MEFLDVLHHRRSVRKFKDKEVEDDKIKEIIEAVRYVPSAHNLQDYYVYVVKNEEAKEKIYKAAKNQNPVKEAPVVFVVLADISKEGTPRAEFYSMQSASAAAFAICLTAENMNLGSVWVGLFDDVKLMQALDIEKNFKPVAIVPVGYPDESPKPPKKDGDYFEILE